MSLYEAILAGLVLLAPGGFWLGYVFLRNDAKWKLAMTRQGQEEPAATMRDLDSLRRELAALKDEVHALRDTSSSFDLSLENSVQRLEERLQSQ